MNLIEGLESRGIRWRKSGKPNNIWICCPFCEERGETPDGRFRLGVDISTGKGNCFNCGWKDSKTAVIKLQQRLDLGDWIETEQVTAKHYRPVRLPEDFTPLGDVSTVRGTLWDRKALKYCLKRGITREQIRRYKIGFSETGRYAYRIVIPIYIGKKLKGIVSRALMASQTPKYKNSVGDKAVFGLPKDRHCNSLVIVEGCFDCLAIARAIGRSCDVVACLGHSLTSRQIEMIEGYDEYILWLDPDEAGIKGVVSMAEQLKLIGKVKVVIPRMEDADPDELSEKEIRRRIDKAKPWLPETESRLKLFLVYSED